MIGTLTAEGGIAGGTDVVSETETGAAARVVVDEGALWAALSRLASDEVEGFLGWSDRC